MPLGFSPQDSHVLPCHKALPMPMIQSRSEGASNNGECVFNHEAVETGTAPSRATVEGVRCRPYSVQWSVQRDEQSRTQTAEDVSEVQSEDCSGAESALGQVQSKTAGVSY